MIANHAQKFNCLFVFVHPMPGSPVRMGDNAANCLRGQRRAYAALLGGDAGAPNSISFRRAGWCDLATIGPQPVGHRMAPAVGA